MFSTIMLKSNGWPCQDFCVHLPYKLVSCDAVQSSPVHPLEHHTLFDNKSHMVSTKISFFGSLNWSNNLSKYSCLWHNDIPFGSEIEQFIIYEWGNQLMGLWVIFCTKDFLRVLNYDLSFSESFTSRKLLKLETRGTYFCGSVAIWIQPHRWRNCGRH